MIAPKRMSSGKYIDLADLKVEDINLYDINQSLNHLYRFTGHCKDAEPLTVAQHTHLCILLAEELFGEEDVVFDCLLHDMPEAYYGDIATPLKNLLKKPYRDLATRIDNVVYEALWGKLPDDYAETKQKRKICDMISLDIERKVMWKDRKGKKLWPDSPKTFSQTQNQKYYDLVYYDTFDLELEYDKLKRK